MDVCVQIRIDRREEAQERAPVEDWGTLAEYSEAGARLIAPGRRMSAWTDAVGRGAALG